MGLFKKKQLIPVSDKQAFSDKLSHERDKLSAAVDKETFKRDKNHIKQLINSLNACLSLHADERDVKKNALAYELYPENNQVILRMAVNAGENIVFFLQDTWGKPYDGQPEWTAGLGLGIRCERCKHILLSSSSFRQNWPYICNWEQLIFWLDKTNRTKSDTHRC